MVLVTTEIDTEDFEAEPWITIYPSWQYGVISEKDTDDFEADPWITRYPSWQHGEITEIDTDSFEEVPWITEYPFWQQKPPNGDSKLIKASFDSMSWFYKEVPEKYIENYDLFLTGTPNFLLSNAALKDYSGASLSVNVKQDEMFLMIAKEHKIPSTLNFDARLSTRTMPVDSTRVRYMGGSIVARWQNNENYYRLDGAAHHELGVEHYHIRFIRTSGGTASVITDDYVPDVLGMINIRLVMKDNYFHIYYSKQKDLSMNYELGDAWVEIQVGEDLIPISTAGRMGVGAFNSYPIEIDDRNVFIDDFVVFR